MDGNRWPGNCTLSDKWQDGMAPWAAHRQTAAAEGKDGNKSPPTAPITEHAHLTEELQSTPWEGDGKTLTCVRAHNDGVKGKMTPHSNQPSAVICYFTKVGVQQTGDQCS